MRALRYAIEEAFTSLWRGRQAGLLSTLTIALALFVLGGFLDVTANLELLGAEWSNAAELSVYLKDDITPAERHAVEGVVAPGDLVAAHEYISKPDALARFKQTFGDLAAAVDGVGGNPLPASIEVRLRPGTGVNGGVDTLASRLRQMAGVADVRYDRQWLTRVLSAINVIRGIGLVLGSVLVVAAGRAGHHEPGRRAAGVCSRPVRHGRGPAGRDRRPDRAGRACHRVSRAAWPLPHPACRGDERFLDPLPSCLAVRGARGRRDGSGLSWRAGCGLESLRRLTES
jgi:hypothetical protein